jgi:diguanylate cyclase
MGVCMASNAEDAGELYSRTDIALYSAKNAGRNCSILYEDGMQKDFTKSWLIYKS